MAPHIEDELDGVTAMGWGAPPAANSYSQRLMCNVRNVL